MMHISKIADIVSGSIEGDNDLNIDGICDIENGKKNHLVYLKDEKYIKFLSSNSASVILLDSTIKLPTNINKTLIRVKNSSLSFIKLMKFFRIQKNPNFKEGIHKTAIIDGKASLSNDLTIGPHVTIEVGAVIGRNVVIKSGSFIGANSKIGDNTFINSNVSIYDNVDIGKNCLIESGTVIGSDGFGISTNNKIHYHIPHIGNVEIGDDVLIGSNCTIDRGTINSTKIGNNSKLDNMIHIGHNTAVGNNCIICGQTGIAGSVNIGDNVTIAGKVAIIDHLNIEDNVTILTGSCVFKSIKSNSLYSGNPARPHKNRVKEDIIISKLPDMYKNFIKK